MLLSVHVDNSELQDRAEEVLKAAGAKDVACSSEAKEMDHKNTTKKDYHPPV
jgi:hypothetical protein